MKATSAAVGEDHVGHRGEVVVQHLDHVLRLAVLGEGREAADVAEQHGHELALAAKAQVLVDVPSTSSTTGSGTKRENRSHALALEGIDDECDRERAHDAQRQRRQRVEEPDDHAR